MKTNLTRYLTTGLTLLIALVLTGCAGGYRLHRSDGVETLYHIDRDGTKQIVYVVDEDRTLRIHDMEDPIIKRFFANHQIDTPLDRGLNFSPEDNAAAPPKWMAAKLIRIGRVKAAKKRDDSDPIFVMLHDAEVGPLMPRFTRGAEQTQLRFRKLLTNALSQDRVLSLTPEMGDVDVFFKSYFMETSAVNVKTHKVVTVNAFCFEAHIRSNYLPEDSYTIKELGHWMDSRDVIKRTADRIGRVIKERIGPNIPKDRLKFLPSKSRGV